MNYKRGDISLFLLLTVCTSLTLLFLLDFTQLSQRVQFFSQQKLQSRLIEHLDKDLNEVKESKGNLACNQLLAQTTNSHVLLLKERFLELVMSYQLNCYRQSLFSNMLNHQLLFGIDYFIDRDELAYYQQQNEVIVVPENENLTISLNDSSLIKSGTHQLKLLWVKSAAVAVLPNGHFQGIILLEDGAILKGALGGQTAIEGVILANPLANIDSNIELIWSSETIKNYTDYYTHWQLQQRSWHDY